MGCNGQNNSIGRIDHCDACVYCIDICSAVCDLCLTKVETYMSGCMNDVSWTIPFTKVARTLPPRSILDDFRRLKPRRKTWCEVRRHGTLNDCWLIAHGKVYDATEVLRWHPAGSTCILERGGGKADCSIDFDYHSKDGQTLWMDEQIGQLVRCKGAPRHTDEWCENSSFFPSSWCRVQ